MNRYQIREEVRSILRDESYPTLDINAAINRVLGNINNAGRFRFQQNIVTITLVSGTYRYTVVDTVLAEYAVVWALGIDGKQKTLEKGSEIIDPLSSGYFITPASEPLTYWRFGTEFWISPVPDATADDYGLSVLCYKDVTELDGDLDVPGIPARYHRTVIAYGAAAELAPAALVRTAAGTVSVQSAADKSMRDLVRQELWNPYQTERFFVDDRFAGAHCWGNVGKIT